MRVTVVETTVRTVEIEAPTEAIHSDILHHASEMPQSQWVTASSIQHVEYQDNRVQPSRTEIAEFWAKVAKSDGDGCWIWQGMRQRNYGLLTAKDGNSSRHQVRAHRFAYEQLIGPIPAGYQLHHVCGNPLCVRPSHLQPLEPKAHARRSTTGAGAINRAKTHCPKGHPYSEENTRTSAGSRYCRLCRAEKEAERIRRAREAAALRPARASNKPPTLTLIELEQRAIARLEESLRQLKVEYPTVSRVSIMQDLARREARLARLIAQESA